MKKIILSIALILSLSIGLSAQENDGTKTKLGQVAPAFSCLTVHGNTVDTKEMKGKVIWINFFATWCSPCKQELPVLENNIMEKYKDNTDFVLVVLGREHDMEEMKKYAKETNLNLPFAPDPGRKIFNMYASQSIPRNVIIGKDGKIAVQSIGYSVEEFKKLENKLAELIK